MEISGDITRKFKDSKILQRVNIDSDTNDRIFQLRGMNSTGKTTAALAIAMYLGFDFNRYKEFIKPDNRKRMEKMLNDTSIDFNIERNGKSLIINRERNKDKSLKSLIRYKFRSNSSETIENIKLDNKEFKYEIIREKILSIISDYIDIDWSIYVTGGILDLINVETEGTINDLGVGKEETLQTDKPIFGLGRITIKLNANVGIKTKQGFVLGPFVIIL